MRKLPLFADSLQPIQRVPGLDQDQSCDRCTLHQYTPAGQRCLNAEGEPGGILVISDYPGEYERKLNRPMAGPAGRWLRELLERVAPDEKVVFTNALGCKPPEGFEDFEPAVEACRPYLAKIIDECQPRMILLMGPYAGLSVLGRTYQPLSVRKGYAWLPNSGNAIPVFLLPNPASATRNRLIAKAIEEDLEWALAEAKACSRESELVLSSGVEFHEIQNEADSEEAATALLESSSMDHLPALDVEASGMNFEPDFRIECIAISNGASTYVWSRKALEDPKMVQPLIALLEAGYFTSWNGLYDFCAIYNDSALSRANGSPVRMRLWSDARLKRKLYESDARASLGIAADLVGMGGHKKEAHDLLDGICKELNKLALSRELTPKGKVRKAPELHHIKQAQIPDIWFEYLKSFDTEKFAYRFMNTQIMHRYCARDAYTTWLLEKWSERRMAEIKDCDLGMVWREVTQPAMWAYSEMTLNGIPLNKTKLTMFSQWLDQEMVKLKRELQIEVGIEDWNPKSDDQLRVEMGKRNLKTKRKTDGGKTGNRKMKVDKESLEDFEDDPFIKKVARYRLLHHTQSNFAAGLIPFVRSDGRIHPTFLLDGTATGRASSSEPNCFSGDTEILTPSGWVRFDALNPQSMVAQWTPPSILGGKGGISFVHSTASVELDYAGDLVSLQNEHTDLLVTPDHRCLLRNRKNNHTYVYPACEYPEDKQQIHAGIYVGGTEHIDPNFIILVCATQADGCLSNGSGIAFTFSKYRKVERLVTALEQLKVPYSNIFRAGQHHVYAKTSDVVDRVYALLGNPKRLGPWILQWDRQSLKAFADELTFWDGVHKARTNYASIFQENVDWAQIAYTLTGDRAAIGTYAYSYDASKCIRMVGVARRDYSLTTNIKKSKVPYSGKVYCVSVPSSYIVVRRNGKVCVTGNCFNQLKGRDEQAAELGKMLRACYEAPPGWVILEHDQGQIEVRMAAFLSQDKNLLAPLQDPLADFHMVNAKAFARAQGKDPNNVTKMDRDNAKTSVFAAFYEIPCELPFLLSVRLDVDRSVGEDLTRAMHTSFPDMLAWMHRCYAESWQRGYSITHWKGKPARRRPLWELAKNPPTLKELEEGLIAEKRARRGSGEVSKSKYDTTSARSTYNGDNQGSAVDVITSALWDVHCWLQANTNGGQLFLTIYDSIMTMVRKEDALKTHVAVTNIMTDPARLSVPMVVEGKWGSSWDKLERIK